MRVEIIGRGAESRDQPYEIGICFDDPARPILVGEGSGRASFDGTIALQRIREPLFRRHLEHCRCQWLIRLAEEEEQRGRRFSADEIFGRWRLRC